MSPPEQSATLNVKLLMFGVVGPLAQRATLDTKPPSNVTHAGDKHAQETKKNVDAKTSRRLLADAFFKTT